MPSGLKRFQKAESLHFVTFSYFHRLPLLEAPGARETVEAVLEKTRARHEARVYAYVLMPEHVHLLVNEPPRILLAQFLKAFKQIVSRRLRGSRERFWQERYYDRQVAHSSTMSTHPGQSEVVPRPSQLYRDGRAWATAIYSGTTGMPYIRHLDWLGSARLSTTWAHTAESKVAYAPFGETYNEAGASANDRSFTGQEQDTVTGSAATGIYDFMFRKYDPAAGRWLSPDPSGWGSASQAYPQSLNRYAYVQNNPMRLTDQVGLDCLYFDDQGVSVESIDHNTNSGECSQNGGDWVNGTVPSADWATYNSNTDSWNVTSIDSATDSFYYTVIGAPGPQADNVPCYGDCTLGYSATSLNFVLNQIVSGTLNGFAQWLSQAQVPLSTFWKFTLGGKFGLNDYCGPNGAGVPLGGNDWACTVHDYNYFSIGATASANLNPFFENGLQLQLANQNLVNNVDNSPEGTAIQAFFHSFGFYPARYAY